MGSFWAKYILLELKKYREVIFHKTEEGYKIWRGIDLSFQNWHKEFDTFWPEHSKVSKTCVLIGFLWPKYILFELQKYWGLSWHWRVYKFWRKIDLWFAKRHEKFGKFSPEHLKVSKLGPWWDPFVQSRKFMSLKFTEELYVMKTKNDATFEGELTFHFKIDMRNLKNFDSNTRKSQTFAL